MRANGVHIGFDSVFMSRLLKPKAMRMRALLWGAFHQTNNHTPPAAGQVSAVRDQAVPDTFYAAIGYRVVHDRVVRVDILDRVSLGLMRLSRNGPFELPRAFTAMLGMGKDQAEPVLKVLGYGKSLENGHYVRIHRQRGAKAAANQRKQKHQNQTAKRKARQKNSRGGDPNSPFARLADLRLPT